MNFMNFVIKQDQAFFCSILLMGPCFLGVYLIELSALSRQSCETSATTGQLSFHVFDVQVMSIWHVLLSAYQQREAEHPRER